MVHGNRRFRIQGLWFSVHCAEFGCCGLRRSGFPLPTETKVESGTSQSKSGTSVDLRKSGYLRVVSLHGGVSAFVDFVDGQERRRRAMGAVYVLSGSASMRRRHAPVLNRMHLAEET